MWPYMDDPDIERWVVIDDYASPEFVGRTGAIADVRAEPCGMVWYVTVPSMHHVILAVPAGSQTMLPSPILTTAERAMLEPS